jgi:hypothetical protein
MSVVYVNVAKKDFILLSEIILLFVLNAVRKGSFYKMDKLREDIANILDSRYYGFEKEAGILDDDIDKIIFIFEIHNYRKVETLDGYWSD